MASLTELGETIQSIQTEGKSGVIMVTGHSAADAAAVTFSLRFETGQLSRANGGGQLNGAAAVMQICSLQRITHLRWMPLGATSNWAGSPEMSAVELAGLFGLAVQANTLVAQAQAKDDTAEVLAHVEDVFMHFYLGDAKADLANVLAKYPPKTERKAFLKACIQLLSPWVGEKEALKLLKR